MKIHPFRAWRPIQKFAEKVACVPYDVIDTGEARELADGNPDSFLHVIRPEIDLPAEIDIYDDKVYQKGLENIQNLLNSDKMLQDDTEHIYVYRLVMEGRSKTGVFTCVSVEEYDNDKILKHEFTRPDKEDDRTKHILTQRAHAEPVMLAHKRDTQVSELVHQITETNPIYDFESVDGIRHTIWKSNNTTPWVEAFAKIPNFYVADGHHRCKAASRVSAEVGDKFPESRFFPAVIFSSDQMHIMAYNRVIFKTNSDGISKLLEKYKVIETGTNTPSEPNHVCFYTDGNWNTIALEQPGQSSNPVQKLDVYKLQNQILEPIFGIADPRSDKNIAFVGGIRGTGALKELVDSGKASIAFSMFPTSLKELMDVSDAGLLMPPKSTWFEPKLRSGLLIHTF